MSPVPLDADLVAKLTTTGGHVPLTDTAGRSVGFFLTPAEYEALRRAAGGRDPDATLGEFRRALANPKRHTTDEVFKLLEG
jgi:hypothetical protein